MHYLFKEILKAASHRYFQERRSHVDEGIELYGTRNHEVVPSVRFFRINGDSFAPLEDTLYTHAELLTLCPHGIFFGIKGTIYVYSYRSFEEYCDAELYRELKDLFFSDDLGKAMGSYLILHKLIHNEDFLRTCKPIPCAIRPWTLQLI